YILDTFRFSSAIPKGIQKQISLAQFVGDTVYVAFRHKFNGESERLCLMLDNVEGPAIVPFKQDLAVNEIIEPDDLSCDLCDRNIVVVLQNKGIEPIANFKLRCQSVGKLGERDTFSTLISEQVQRQILPGDTIHYAFLSTLPLSLYEEGPYFIRSFISVSGDQYAANDTLVGTFHKQKSSNIPFASGFEETDKDAIGWYYHTPSTAALKSFSIGENPLFANKGTGYLTSSVYTSFDTLAYPSRRGDDAFVATRCVRLEKENQYKINFYYAFRKCGGDAKVKKINMRVLIGADQHHLLENGKILFDTVLLWDRKFVTNGEQALYSFFNTNNFALEESGAYYLGFVFYSDDYVTDPSKEWMLFVDNVSITDAAAQQLVDLSLDQVLVPYDCNLGENETIALVVRNASTQALSNIKASYTIDNTQKVEETILDTIYPNTQFTYTFKTLANLSQHKKYRIQAKIAHLQDTVLENNENSQISENKTIAQLPFYDGFENIGTTVNFEDEYNVISTGYYTWSVVMDYTDNKEYAYKGSNFLVDATDNERYVIADDWIMGTCFEFQKDTTYQISIAYRIEKASVAIANLKLSILASYDTASLVQSLGDLNNITNTNYHIFNVEYTPSQTHIGHFAMHSLGQIQAPIVMLDELNISTKASIATEKSVDFNLQVSPNPAKDFIQITSSLQIDKIELINMMGGSVYAQHTHETLHNHVIPLANLPKGVYFLILNTTDNRRICKKIIVS
ncbi:MAG: T9SS type A sorting domain-containing protein, partial [Bacteroidales bacterium]